MRRKKLRPKPALETVMTLEVWRAPDDTVGISLHAHGGVRAQKVAALANEAIPGTFLHEALSQVLAGMNATGHPPTAVRPRRSKPRRRS